VALTPNAPGLADRLWQATSSEASSIAAGEAGTGLLLARAAPRTGQPVARVQRPLAEAYLGAYARAGHRAPPRLGMTRTVYPAADRRTALGHLEAGTRLWSRQMLADLPTEDQTLDDLVAQHSLYTGDASQVAEALAADAALPLATDLLIQVQPGLPTFAQTVAALETVASAVAPALGLQLAAHT
jgi:hypothetical protein